MSEKSVVLEPERFSDFLRTITILKDICNDIDIRQGHIRQQTNDNSCKFEIDLTSLIQDFNIPISNLSQKLDLFKIFIGQQVEISVNETKFSFSDQFSKLIFNCPFLEYLDNKYIDKEVFDSAISLNPEDLILNCQIPKIISDRIKTIGKGFNVNSIQINFLGDTAELLTKTTSKDQEAKLLKDIITNKQIENENTYMPIIPFIIDHDDEISLEMYEGQNDFCINKFSTNISDININIYCRSQMKS